MGRSVLLNDLLRLVAQHIRIMNDPGNNKQDVYKRQVVFRTPGMRPDVPELTSAAAVSYTHLQHQQPLRLHAPGGYGCEGRSRRL